MKGKNRKKQGGGLNVLVGQELKIAKAKNTVAL